MNKLKAANLYRSELIPVSGKLVERYNACLDTLGFKKTKLKTFSIDGIGWSPEVAEEKKNINYLNHGDANPHGIIISPLQKGKPVYIPYHTFDREMMKYVFKTYETKINDITRDSAICLDFDQDIDMFYAPLDLLKYDAISINFRLINDLEKKQQQQLELIDTFRSGNNFIDETIHNQLLDSAKTYGDLRHRDLVLKPLQFKTDSFYTRAFGGVYILRDFITPIVVFEDEDAHKEAIKDTMHDVLIYHISQTELMTKLKDHLIIDVDLEKVVKTKQYQRIKSFMFYNELQKPEHPIAAILSDKVLYRRYINKIDVNALKRVNGVEIYLERMERSNAFKVADLVDTSMYHALHQPHSSLEAKHQDLIWKLLVNVSAKDVLFMYWYDKQEFYEQYENWDDSFRDWVIETIKSNI
ncbi:DUF6638 family protein [Ichthyenterobacterium sp. W332]|uniref:DUF6638 family protein n=1 Tax=Microcosmobacter mediterraneus TaxID=3075607 RepID=A0ABU2YKV2_9FLAO|nr:DUF6638 family protein [Ichthyenterobacterium sp. W332]MDT0558783.1 DUF6638 family protein [Ichthyenterobacterium sp. W332]